MIDKQRLQDAKAGDVKEQFSVGMYYYEGAFGLGEKYRLQEGSILAYESG